MRLKEWLAPYEGFLETGAFLEAVLRASQTPADEEDPARFFQKLMAPVHLQHLSAKAIAAQWTTDKEEEVFDASAEAAVEYCLEMIRPAARVPASEAVKLAESYANLGQFDASAVASAVAYLSGHRTPLTYALVAAAALRAGRKDVAAEAVAEGSALHPDAYRLSYYRALLAAGEGRLDEAARALEAVVEAHPDFRPAWNLLLEVLSSQARWEECAARAQEAVSHHSTAAAFWERLGLALRACHRLEEALRALHRASLCAAESVGLPEGTALRIRLEIAALEGETGGSLTALETYRALLAEGKRDPDLYLGAATCVRGLGRLQEAKDLLREGLARNPDNGDLLSSLGELLFEGREDGEAFEKLQAAAERDGSRSRNLLLMGMILLRNGRSAEALQLAEGVIRSAPAQSPEGWVLAGDACRFQGAWEAARDAYREALALSPSDLQIEERLRETEKALAQPQVRSPGTDT